MHVTVRLFALQRAQTGLRSHRLELPEGADVATAWEALVADLPGKIVRVQVQPGQAVQAGQSLIIIESMKMEIPVEADMAGEITAIDVAEGEEGVTEELQRPGTAGLMGEGRLGAGPHRAAHGAGRGQRKGMLQQCRFDAGQRTDPQRYRLDPARTVLCRDRLDLLHQCLAYGELMHDSNP